MLVRTTMNSELPQCYSFCRSALKNLIQLICLFFSWAVSTVAAIEAAAFITNGTEFSQSLSFQQLISCDEEDSGCNGGNIVRRKVTAMKVFASSSFSYTLFDKFYAMKYAWKNSDFGAADQIGGLATLNDYPFTDMEGGTGTETCQAPLLNATIFLEEPQVLSTFVVWVVVRYGFPASYFLIPFFQCPLTMTCRLRSAETL